MLPTHRKIVVFFLLEYLHINSYLMKYTYIILSILLFTNCRFIETKTELPSVPLIYYSFNGSAKNTGIEMFSSIGSQYLSYASGINDSCFDLSLSAKQRIPMIINTKEKMHLDRYNGFSMTVWVKQVSGSFEEYAIIGNKSLNKPNEKGWMLSTTKEGSWKFEISDGTNTWNYKASSYRQIINDGNWHQLAVVVNKTQKEIHLYYDGNNVGILSIAQLNSLTGNRNIHIGCDPDSKNYAQDSFYGCIDEVGLWTKVLFPSNIKESYYKFNSSIDVDRTKPIKNDFKVLSWNIWNGGKEKGREAGLDMVSEIIENSKADFISLQETNNSGEYIADKLGYYHFKRSNNLSFLSKYPIEQTFDIYKETNFGVVKINIEKDLSLYLASIELNNKPNIRGLLMNSLSNVDSIVSKEKSTRGKEVQFILNEMKQLSNKGSKRDAFIISGDLNSGSHLDWTAENKDHKNGLVIPFPATMYFEKMGYTDSFREIFPDETKVFGTTFSPIFTEGYQDRLDYTYYKGTSIKPIEAEVITNSNSFFPSKRGALLTTFKITE